MVSNMRGIAEVHTCQPPGLDFARVLGMPGCAEERTCPLKNGVRESYYVDEDVLRSISGQSRLVRRRQPRFIATLFVSAFLATFFFLIVSDSAKATARLPTRFKPTRYEVVPGFFAQSLNSTDDTAFDFVLHPIPLTIFRASRTSVSLMKI
jgi:hypothetical protein